MQNKKSEKDLILELLTIQQDGTTDFTERSKEIIEELSDRYKESDIYKQGGKERSEWLLRASAREVYDFLCMKIKPVPTSAHAMAAIKILIPVLWEKIQEEKTITATVTVGKTEDLLRGKIWGETEEY